LSLVGGVLVSIFPTYVAISLDGEVYRIATEDSAAALGVVVEFLENEPPSSEGAYAVGVLRKAIERFMRK
jgi:hypothetical protein